SGRRGRRSGNAAAGICGDGAPARYARASRAAGAGTPDLTLARAGIGEFHERKREAMERPSLLHRTAAELFGTYALVAAGCGAIVVNSQTGVLGHVGVALTFGLVGLVMVA